MLKRMQTWQRTLWIMVAAQALSAIGFSSIFPFLPLYVDHLGSRWGLSLEFLAGMVFSAQAFTMMLASPLWGNLADRVGRKPMVARAIFGAAVTIFLMAFVGAAEDLVILRAIQGFLTGTIGAANALIASIVPRERSGYALGLLQMGLLSGVALGPLVGGVLKDFVGFEAAFIMTAVLQVIGGLLVVFGVKENFIPQGAQKRPSMLQQWHHVLASQGVPLVFGARFLVWLARTMIVPFAPLFIAALLIDASRLGTLTGLFFAASSLGGIVSTAWLGKLGDTIGHKPVLVVCTLAAASAYLPMGMITNVWQGIVLSCLAGLAIGGILPALSALLNLYTKEGDEGTVYGLDNAVVAAARAFSPLLGAGIALLLGIQSIFFIAGIMFLIMALLALWKLPNFKVVSAVATD